MADAADSEKPERKRPAWLEHGLALLLACAFGFFRLLPLSVARAIGRGVGKVTYFFFGPDFLNVQKHVQIALREELTPAQRERLVYEYWQHLPQVMIEAAHLKFCTRENARDYFVIPDLAELNARKAQGKGAILVSGHIGNWDAGPYILAVLGYNTVLVHNPGSVPPVFEYIKRQREIGGLRLSSRFEQIRTLKREIDAGAFVCLASDMNAGRRGTFLPFFGVQASSYISAAALQQFTGVPIFILTAPRLPDGKLEVKLWKTIEPVEAQDRAADRLRIMHEIHATLEASIRAYPVQWLWHYRRFRSRPAGEVPGPDGLPPRVLTAPISAS